MAIVNFDVLQTLFLDRLLLQKTTITVNSSKKTIATGYETKGLENEDPGSILAQVSLTLQKSIPSKCYLIKNDCKDMRELQTDSPTPDSNQG